MKFKTLNDHLKFHKDDSSYPFKDFNGYKRAYFIPDNVIYTNPNGVRYLILSNPTDNHQHILFVSDSRIAEAVGYHIGKQYIEAHSGRGFVVYAFLAAFNEVIYRPASWFDHVKNHPEELKRSLELLEV